MRKFSSKLAGQQSGFTLIELVIVIVIIGILAAVAIPNLSSSAEEARKGKAMATLGALKGSWGIAYANARSSPTNVQVAAQMGDPSCSAISTTGISCVGVMVATGGTPVTFAVAAAPIASPSQISCAPADCGAASN